MKFSHVLLLFFVFLLNGIFSLPAKNKLYVTEMQISKNDSLFKINYLYNSLAQKVLETKTFQQNNSWQNLAQTEWFYDDTFVTKQLIRSWQDNEWKITQSIEYSSSANTHTQIFAIYTGLDKREVRKLHKVYLANNHFVTSTYLNVQSNWKLGSESHTYLTNSVVDSSIISVFDQDTLVQKQKFVYSYYPDGRLHNHMNQKLSESGDWVNENKTTWSYNPLRPDLISSQKRYKWQVSNNIWIQDAKTTYEYDSSENKTEEIFWYWNTVSWFPVLRYTYALDESGSLQKMLTTVPIYRDWRNFASVIYTASADSLTQSIEAVYDFWGGKTGQLIQTDIAFRFNNELIIEKAKVITLKYEPYIDSAITEKSTLNSLLVVYPNPTSGILYIQNFNTSFSQWEILTLRGEVIRKSHFSSLSAALDIADLPTGMYLLRVLSGKELRSIKIVKR